MNAPVTPARLAFVSAPGGSAFMEEILSAVADAVEAAGTPSLVHQGFISEVAEPGTRFVVVPHEYFVLAPEEPAELYARTVGFGVEHPGTRTFSTSVAKSRRLGAWFEISRSAASELRLTGLAAEHFQFGYVERWDRWKEAESRRPVDIIYLGTADERRLGVLARVAGDLDGLSCEFLIPPHEPMTRERPDFLLSERKWQLLAQSKVLLNLHREDKLGFEWIRGLEAMHNGCVVVTEPSTDLGPLVPGAHLVVAHGDRIGAVAAAVAGNEPLRRGIAERAYRFCRSELRMDGAARRLVDVALALEAASSAPEHRVTAAARRAEGADEGPLAVWIPEAARLPARDEPGPEGVVSDMTEPAQLRSAPAQVPSPPAKVTRASRASPNGRPVDVICVRRPGDGPLGATVDSLRDADDLAALHIASSPSVDGNALLAKGDRPLPPLGGVTTYLVADRLLGRGPARNLLLESSRADLICVVDSGDELRVGALRRLSAMMVDDKDLDVAFAMATHGPDRLVNVLVPEARRIARRIYLTRGLVVRRRLLERIGGFSEDPLVEGFVDHVFWRDALAAGASVRLARWIGFSLWPQTPGPLPAETAPDLACSRILGHSSDQLKAIPQ